MSFYNFCISPHNYVARERLLHTKVVYEMKLHAAKSNRQLQMTEPEIDNLGYDFTAALGYDHIYLQNKSTLSDSGVASWSVHARFLQPAFHDRDVAPVVEGTVNGIGTGGGGGVLLHIVDAEDARTGSLSVKYYYFDLYYAAAVYRRLWTAENFTSEEAARLINESMRAGYEDRMQLPLRAFLPITSPAAVIAFRFHVPLPSNYVSMCNISPVPGDSSRLMERTWGQSIVPWIRL